MYATIVEEAVKDATVVTVTLLIHSAPATVLFDSGSMATFISKTFVDRIDMPVEDLGYDLVVSTPAGAILVTRVCVRGVVVLIQ